LDGSIEVPEWFTKDFYAVCIYYKCDKDDIKKMKKTAWENFEDAKRCYYFLAREIDSMTTVSAAEMVIESKKKIQA